MQIWVVLLDVLVQVGAVQIGVILFVSADFEWFCLLVQVWAVLVISVGCL